MADAPFHSPAALEAAQAAQASAEGLADALKVSELRYRRLFETARDGILILDSRTGTISDVNPFLTELLGYGREEFLNKELWEIGLLKDKEASQSAFLTLQEEGFIRYEDLPLATRRGEQREVEFVSNLYREDGHTVIQCNIRDITDRKAAERKAKALSEQLLTEALERADRDSLTSLLNHRAFYRRLQEEADRTKRDSGAFAVAMLDLDNFKFFNDVYGHGVGDQVLRAVADCLTALCRPYDAVARFGGDEFALLLGGIGTATYQEIATLLRARTGDLHFLPEGQEVAVPITLSVGVALFPDDDLGLQAVLDLADARLMRAKTGAAEEAEASSAEDNTAAYRNNAGAGFSLLDALVTAVDNKDRYTRQHSEDVQNNSLLIARALGLSEDELRTVALAALVHDVGNIGVPDALLRKPGKLSEEEFQTVQLHPQMGAVIVSSVPGLEETVDAVRHHHERWDGMGYPMGLRAEEIPLLARILAVADAFSSLTTNRPYRKAISREAALLLLKAGAGTQWDPLCVTALLSAQ